MEFVIEERASKGIVNEFYSNISRESKDYQAPPFMYDIMSKMVDSDPILFTATSLTADLATYNGYTFLGKNNRDIEKAMKMFNEDLDFDRVIKNLIWQYLTYGECYLEIVWNDTKTEVKELHPRDTKDMKINYDKHGEILGYVETVKSKGKDTEIPYTTDEIIYFRQYWFGSSVYSKAPFTAISRSFSTRTYANDYLQMIFRNLPPQVVYFLKNANEKQKEEFYENLIRAKTNPGTAIIAQGEEFDAKIVEPNFQHIIDIIKDLRKEVLMIFRVPPHWAGDLDGANRGIGENVVIPYETKIKTIQSEIASQINRELMEKLKLPKLKFKWNAISLMDDKTILENMQMLSGQRFDSETIIQYGRDKGLKLNTNASIEDLNTSSDIGGAPQIQKDGAPSRQRENPKSDKMGQGIDKKGVSQAGKAKLEKKQVM